MLRETFTFNASLKNKQVKFKSPVFIIMVVKANIFLKQEMVQLMKDRVRDEKREGKGESQVIDGLNFYC